MSGRSTDRASAAARNDLVRRIPQRFFSRANPHIRCLTRALRRRRVDRARLGRRRRSGPSRHDGDVDRHFGERFGAAALLSIVGGGAQFLGAPRRSRAGQVTTFDPATGQTITSTQQTLASQGAQIGTQEVARTMTAMAQEALKESLDPADGSCRPGRGDHRRRTTRPRFFWRRGGRREDGGPPVCARWRAKVHTRPDPAVAWSIRFRGDERSRLRKIPRSGQGDNAIAQLARPAADGEGWQDKFPSLAVALGRLGDLLADPMLTEISVNAPGVVFVERPATSDGRDLGSAMRCGLDTLVVGARSRRDQPAHQ